MNKQILPRWCFQHAGFGNLGGCPQAPAGQTGPSSCLFLCLLHRVYSSAPSVVLSGPPSAGFLMPPVYYRRPY